MPIQRDRAYVWLSLSGGLGPRRVARLFSFCADPVALMSMSLSDWAPYVGESVATNMREARERADDMMEALERLRVRVVTRESPEYPADLLAIYDPPVALYVKGSASLAGERTMSMVGSRRCTRYGREMATEIAADLARQGVVVVSGLARGIDTACHVGALAGGGETIAVLGCGVDVVYPPENGALYERIADSGAIVSEYLPGTQPLPGHFPLRNRIIAGLSMGLVLVEAAPGSGAMITVDYALDHGRTIFALPGNVTSSQSSEPHRLIRDGAVLTACARDILQEMGWEEEALQRPPQEPPPAQLTLEQAAILEAAGQEEISFEELLQATGMQASALNSHLTMLVAQGIIKQSPGRIFWVDRKYSAG